MTVDLRTCVPGQLVELRNGNIVRYGYRSKDLNTYPHRVKDSFYTDDGHYFLSGEEDDEDVVKILQLDKPEPPKSDTHLSVAWWESCPWITDRKPTREDGDKFGRVFVKMTEARVVTILFSSVHDNEAWIHHHDWKPPTLTDKEQALQLLDDHRDGWRPTPEQWNIIRKGLTK